MAKTEAQKRANENYRKKHLDYITIQTKKEDRIRDLVHLATHKMNCSSNEYMINAVKNKLNMDGITIDMLSDKPIKPVVIEKRTKPISQPKQHMVYLVTSAYLDDEDKINMQNGTALVFEEYVAVLSTLNMAKTYIQNKLKKKAHPEDWQFTIYGRYFEASTKLEATNKYREMALEAVKKEDESWNNDTDEYGSIEIAYFIYTLDKYRKPDYVEVIRGDKDNTN